MADGGAGRANTREGDQQTAEPWQPRGSAYAAGRQARQLITRKATALFKVKGYDNTSLRDVARAADMTLSSVQYHFKSKENLFRACIDVAVNRARRSLGRRDNELAVSAGLTGGETRRDLLDVMRKQVESSMHQLAIGNSTVAALSMIPRHGGGAEIFSELLFERFYEPSFKELCGLVARITGRDADSPQTRLLSLDIAGRMMVIRHERSFFLKVMGWEDLEGPRLAILTEQIWNGILATLESATLKKGDGSPSERSD